jgi:hypothetical protein
MAGLVGADDRMTESFFEESYARYEPFPNCHNSVSNDFVRILQIQELDGSFGSAVNVEFFIDLLQVPAHRFHGNA